MEDQYDSKPIKICLIDNSQYTPKIIPTYVVLGFLDEYMGRINLGGEGYVERFYPAEQSLVEVFTNYLEDISRNENIKTVIEVNVGTQGHHYVESAEIAKYISDLYGKNYVNSIYENAHGISESMFPPLSNSTRVLQYENEPVDCRFSYLLGAYMRYGRDNAFQLANASHKVDLIINFLERLGAKWISKKWTIGGAPTVKMIQFGPDEVLARLFEIAPSGWDFGFQKPAYLPPR